MTTGRATVGKQSDILTQLTNPSGLNHNQKTVTTAGTAESLASSTPLIIGVTVKALSSNTGNVYVGSSSVDSSDGYILGPGEQQFVPINNLATVFIDVDTNGEGVSFLGN